MADFEGIKQRQSGRLYIDRLQNDHRLHTMFTGWVAQALREAELRADTHRSPYLFAQRAAERALELALSHILDNDGEYQAVRAELERSLKSQIELANNALAPIIIAKDGSEIASHQQKEESDG